MSSELVENNMMQVIRDLVDRVGRLEKSNLRATELSEISSDMGIIRSGGFVASNDGYLPDEPEFTGTFMHATGFEFNGGTYHLGGVNTGVLMWGGNSTTGKFIFCGNNAQIDSDGISGTDLLKWLVRQSATYGTEERYGQLGMEELDEKPVWTLSYFLPDNDPDELVANGDFDTGFTNWTKTTETNGTWYVTTYTAGGWTKAAEFYKSNSSGSAVTCTGVLTSDRIAVTEATNYYFTARIRSANRIGSGMWSAWGTPKIEVKWYDHASAGSLISTDVCYSGSCVDFVTVQKTMTAPSGALSCEIVSTLSQELPDGYNAAFLTDDYSMYSLTVSNKLQLTDDDLLFNGDSVITDSTVYSGTYTPTLTNTTNIDASTVIECRYFRMGSHVIVSGQVAIDPTSAAATVLGISLPIASTLSNVYELSGTGATNSSEAGRISADTTNNRASYTFTATGINNRAHSFVFTYQII